MPASDPEQGWWMKMTEGPKGNSCSQTEIIEERTNIRKAKLKATGDYEIPRGTTRDHGRQRDSGRQWEVMGGNERYQEATGGNRGQFSRTDIGSRSQN